MNDKIIRSKNKLWHFYFRNGIFARQTDLNTAQLITPDAHFDFDVISDSEGSLHLICQDKAGTLIYYFNTSGIWHKRILLMSKTHSAYNKGFKLIACGKLIFAVYSIVKESRVMLVFHCITENLTPEVIDFITPSPRSFFSLTAENSDILIYYTNEKEALGSVRYKWSKKAFLPFEKLYDGGLCPFSDSQSLAFIKNGRLFKGDEEIFSPHGGEVSPPVIYSGAVMWHAGSVAYCKKDGGAVKKLLLPFALPQLFEIKNSSNPVYLYGGAKNSVITLAAPDGFLKPEDLFFQKKESADRIDLILERLTKIETILKDVKDCL